MRRTDDTVILYARSGRVVTPYWMDLALAGMALRPGTVLDGEAVIWREGRLDFAIGTALAGAEVMGERRTERETYTRIQTDLTVEVLAGSGRHGTLTVVRMR
ncbi:hypothetical protein [Streptomyces sp. NPDC059460]|uniref:hypothetical protein n=1 Tax=Streptomyces sp. NPDC059460 TaxID=3346840 RepID=UPI0036C4403E